VVAMSYLIRRIDAALKDRLELTPCACGCGKHIGPNSSSPWFAGEGCQRTFTARANKAALSPKATKEPDSEALHAHVQRLNEQEFERHRNHPCDPWAVVPGELAGQPIARWEHEDPVRELWSSPALGSDHEHVRLLGYRCVKTGCRKPSAGTTDFCRQHTSFFVRLVRKWREWLPVMGVALFAGFITALASKLGWFQ
jgi:hypothetical protein